MISICLSAAESAETVFCLKTIRKNLQSQLRIEIEENNSLAQIALQARIDTINAVLQKLGA